MNIKAVTVSILLALPLWANARDLTLIYTNDLHAHVDTYKLPCVANGTRECCPMTEKHLAALCNLSGFIYVC